MFFENFLSAINQLDESERATACYEFCKYGITGELPKNKNLAMFCLGVSASVQKYQGRGGARIGAGAPKGNKNAQKQCVIENNQNNQINQKIQNNQNIQKQQTETETETETETLNRNIKENLIKEKRFSKPSIEEIKKYCLERKNSVIAETFFDFYESKGWKIGNSPMKDWKAAVRTWEKKERERRTLQAAKGLFGVRSETYGEDIPL
jgi:hypothetical protein